MQNAIEYECRCSACEGTGLYVGFAELAGAAIVCHTCKGTGNRHIKIEFEPAGIRKEPTGVIRVYATNPGIVTAPTVVSGGVPLEEWIRNPSSVNERGAEMRDHTCPAWWYQSTQSDKKPDWRECIIAGTFSRCASFTNKAQCWRKWDKEQQP